jgi:hypothetical protein
MPYIVEYLGLLEYHFNPKSGVGYWRQVTLSNVAELMIFFKATNTHTTHYVGCDGKDYFQFIESKTVIGDTVFIKYPSEIDSVLKAAIQAKAKELVKM